MASTRGRCGCGHEARTDGPEHAEAAALGSRAPARACPRRSLCRAARSSRSGASARMIDSGRRMGSSRRSAGARSCRAWRARRSAGPAGAAHAARRRNALCESTRRLSSRMVPRWPARTGGCASQRAIPAGDCLEHRHAHRHAVADLGADHRLRPVGDLGVRSRCRGSSAADASRWRRACAAPGARRSARSARSTRRRPGSSVSREALLLDAQHHHHIDAVQALLERVEARAAGKFTAHRASAPAARRCAARVRRRTRNTW